MAARTPRPSDLRGAEPARALLWLLRASLVILVAVAGILLGLTPATAVVAPPPTSAAATSYDGCGSIAHARELAVLRHGVGVVAGEESLSLGGGSAYVGDSGVAAEGATGASNLLSPSSLADEVANATGGALKANKGGYTITIPQGSRGITVRVMEQGGGRTNYYRVSVPGAEAYTVTGDASTDAALTHIDIGERSLDDILNIIARIQGGQ